ncbi:MAG: polysaccharide biosynthesis protein [Ruminococcaceae bacterium]|nr:polysaccharide biosynthesis protein [Oscillospiraceae bacterium]
MPASPSLHRSSNPLQRTIFIGVLDILSIAVSWFAALWLRFDFQFSEIETEYLNAYATALLPWCAVVILVFVVCRLYSSIWGYAGADELLRVIGAYCLLFVAGYLLVKVLGVELPRSCYIIGMAFNFLATLAIRFAYRLLRNLRAQWRHFNKTSREKNIMLIGAGEAGRMLATEFFTSSHLRDTVVCVIDDDPVKQGKRLCGVPIVGGREDIPRAVREFDVDKIIFAIPAATGSVRKAILDICSTTGCPVQMVPGIYQLAGGDISVSNLREVGVEELLGRDPICGDAEEIAGYIKGKTVMVTGAGGSIGSELCRQIARANPRQLVLFDIYENSTYDIQLELEKAYPDLPVAALIGSVRNTARVNAVMKKYTPDIVFHAAAHKHVPLMESSPNEAIKNNVFGTYKLAKAASDHGVKRFVLISTDKAVNPTNIMGASKRLCEMVVQMMNRASETEFAAVRFGNVLGSNGSVIPLFKRQIAQGGPVTVTHPDIVRYFMTIPEAVSLVLQAGHYARGGEIFVLDMGEPVKIDDMARNLIRLSGYEPDVDISIEYTGLRPGEKLFEELLMAEEGLKSTANHRIHIGKPIEMDDALFKQQLEKLEEACRCEEADIKQLVAQMVPTYTPSEGTF